MNTPEEDEKGVPVDGIEVTEPSVERIELRGELDWAALTKCQRERLIRQLTSDLLGLVNGRQYDLAISALTSALGNAIDQYPPAYRSRIHRQVMTALAAVLPPTHPVATH